MERSHYPDAPAAHLWPCQVHGCGVQQTAPAAITSHHYLQTIVLLSLPNKINNKQQSCVALGRFVTNIKEGEMKVARRGSALKSSN